MDLELSLYIGKFMAIIYLVIGLAVLTKQDYYKKLFSSFMDNAPAMMLSGFGALIIGLILVLNHNFWVGDWTLLITIFGWISILKGVFLLMLPKVTDQLWGPLLRKPAMMSFAGALALLIGLYFAYFSFVV